MSIGGEANPNAGGQGNLPWQKKKGETFRTLIVIAPRVRRREKTLLFDNKENSFCGTGGDRGGGATSFDEKRVILTHHQGRKRGGGKSPTGGRAKILPVIRKGGATVDGGENRGFLFHASRTGKERVIPCTGEEKSKSGVSGKTGLGEVGDNISLKIGRRETLGSKEKRREKSSRKSALMTISSFLEGVVPGGEEEQPELLRKEGREKHAVLDRHVTKNPSLAFSALPRR